MTISIEYMGIDELRPHPRNPKGHLQSSIETSMDRFGYTNPMLIDERTGLLAAGHGRLAALLAKRERGDTPPQGVRTELGVWTVPVARGWASLNNDEADAYLVADNQNTIGGGWDSTEMLLEILQTSAYTEWSLEGTGFTSEDLDALLGQGGTLLLDDAASGDQGISQRRIACPQCGFEFDQ